eukprot:15393159-Heterocapsa_arctica.AAC.1
MSSVRPANSECQRTRCTDEAQKPNVTDVFVGRPVQPRSRQSAATGRGHHEGVRSRSEGRPGSRDREEPH